MTSIATAQFGIKYESISLQELHNDNIRLVKKIEEDLKKHKFILFKNQAQDAEAFLAFTELIAKDFVSYKGGAYVREKVKKNNNTLLSVTGGSGMKLAIPMHGEMHYKKIKPPRIWFCCLSAPESNGETTLCDAERLYDILSLEAKTLFNNHKIQYIRTYDEERWQGVFQTTNIEDAIPFFEANEFEYQLDDKNNLTTTYTSQAFHIADNGAYHFINNILPISYQERNNMPGNIVRLDNGEKIPDSIIDEIIEKADQLTVANPWVKGDVVLIDNFRAMHGRNTITCNNRNIIVRMSD